MYPTDAATDAAILAGRVKAAWLVDLYCRTSGGAANTIRLWDWPGPAYYPGTVDLDGSTANRAYESMYGRMLVPMAVRQAVSLSSEPLEITLDASRSSDDDDPVGRFVDSTWHQCRIRVRQVAMDWQSEAFYSAPMREWRGLMDHRELIEPEDPEQPRVWQLSCQGGLFRVRGRRLRTRSHEDQQIRAPGDMFYSGTAAMVGRPLNWAKKPGNIPGVATGSGAVVNGGPASKFGDPKASLW